MAHDYTPLASSPDGEPDGAQHEKYLSGRVRRRLSLRLGVWLLLLGAVLTLVNVICLVVRQTSRLPASPLENFQVLNHLPIVAPLAPTTRDERAVVTTMYSDSYAHGVATLGHSLRTANVSARLIVAYLPDRVSPRALCLARAAGWTPEPIARIPPPHRGKGVIPRFVDQYTKLRIWTFDRLGVRALVYLDADTLVRGNFDELFDLPFHFAAVPDVFVNRRGFVTDFNAGMMLLRPSSAVFDDMLSKLETARFPPGMAEQAFLNVYFGAHALRLPFVYNGNLAVKGKSPGLWRALAADMRVVHYTIVKPFAAFAPDGVLDPAREAKALEAGKHAYPIYAPELDWWGNAWDDFRNTSGDAIAQCERATSRFPDV